MITITKEEIFCLIFGICAFASAVLGYYFHVRAKISEKAPDAINEAEDEKLSGGEKLEAATDFLYSSVPAVLRPIINKNQIRSIIQFTFDKVAEFAKKQ